MYRKTQKLYAFGYNRQPTRWQTNPNRQPITLPTKPQPHEND